KDIYRAVAVRSSDGMIASGDGSGKIRLWDGKTGRYLRTFANQGGAVGKLVFSPDGKLLMSTERDGSYHCYVWDVATGKKTITYTKHDNGVFAGAVSPDGRLAATAGGERKEIHIWDLATGDTKHVLAGTGATVWSVAVSTDAKRLAWGTTY